MFRAYSSPAITDHGSVVAKTMSTGNQSTQEGPGQKTTAQPEATVGNSSDG